MKHTIKLHTPAARLFAGMLIATVMLPGCETIKSIENPFTQKSAEEAAAESALSAGIALYDRGEYAAAVKKLAGSNEIWKARNQVQLEALKYMAFSYCVTSQPVPCRYQFDKALKLDPSFDLAPGEKGHPLWGPVFERAKKSVAR
jgi:hypothetical protein